MLIHCVHKKDTRNIFLRTCGGPRRTNCWHHANEPQGFDWQHTHTHTFSSRQKGSSRLPLVWLTNKQTIKTRRASTCVHGFRFCSNMNYFNLFHALFIFDQNKHEQNDGTTSTHTQTHHWPNMTKSCRAMSYGQTLQIVGVLPQPSDSPPFLPERWAKSSGLR